MIMAIIKMRCHKPINTRSNRLYGVKVNLCARHRQIFNKQLANVFRYFVILRKRQRQSDSFKSDKTIDNHHKSTTYTCQCCGIFYHKNINSPYCNTCLKLSYSEHMPLHHKNHQQRCGGGRRIIRKHLSN